MTTPDLDDAKRERRRQQCRVASRRRRERERQNTVLFRLALSPERVVLALIALARDAGRDLTDHRACEAALAQLIEDRLEAVIADFADDEFRALVSSLKLKSKQIA